MQIHVEKKYGLNFKLKHRKTQKYINFSIKGQESSTRNHEAFGKNYIQSSVLQERKQKIQH